MDRNISEKLNKAFEAYRNASIEKDAAKKELQQKTEQFERDVHQLKRKIEEQEQLISELKAQLISASQHASGEMKCCEVAHRKQETERSSLSDHWPGDHYPRTNHALKKVMDCASVVPGLPGVSGTEDVIDALQEIQGTFQRIQTLARRQKDHLKRIRKGNDTANEQQFSMPIQCTDDTPEHPEVPFSSSSGPELNDCLTFGALASRGISPDDANFMDGVKFPPSTDSEYDFLNSAPDRTAAPVLPGKGVSTGMEGSHPVSSSATPQLPASSAHEGIRGPQQPLWISPDLSTESSEKSSMESAEVATPNPCAFCNAAIPQELIYSHLNSHFQVE